MRRKIHIPTPLSKINTIIDKRIREVVSVFN